MILERVPSSLNKLPDDWNKSQHIALFVDHCPHVLGFSIATKRRNQRTFLVEEALSARGGPWDDKPGLRHDPSGLPQRTATCCQLGNQVFTTQSP